MCGIAGYFGATRSPMVLAAMVRKLAHRGPDGEGFHSSAPVHMGMRRLSIIDLQGGDQPVYSEDKTLAIVFNGEIYNYREERENLIRKGHRFSTRSDTEVILKLYEEYGVNCVNYLRGMFAFAIHDQQKNLVFMARDRLGVKPLYYSTTQTGDFVFASEVKALFEHPGVHAVPDLLGVDAYLSMRYSPGPGSMFKGVRKLPAGHRLIWNPGLHVMVEPYWTWESHKQPDKALKTDADFQARFDALFEEAVRLRLVADVPLGAFLSGGVDSSAIAAAMARQSGAAINTFSVGFGWEGDELADARETAKRLGANHREVICHQADMEKLPELIWALDEPVGDPIIVPMHLLSQMAARHVKVALSGEGADEMLAGYFMHKTLLQARRLPKAFFRIARPFVSAVPPFLLDLAFDYPGKMGKRSKRKLVDFMGEMQGSNLSRQYHFLISLFDRRDKKWLYDAPMKQVMETFFDTFRSGPEWPTLLSSMLALQQPHWLPDDILTKLDKMTMINSLEGRVPFMDHKLVEFLLGAPDHLKYAGGRNKILLRNYVEKVLPGISARPKKAFYVPLEKYLNVNPLKDMVDLCLSERSIRKRGLFDYDAVRYILGQVKTGDFVYAKQVFSLLALELWFRIYIDNEKGWISS